MTLGRFLALVLLVLLVVGFVRGWFGFSAGRQPVDEKVNVEFTLDPAQVQRDAEVVQERTEEFGERVSEEVEDLKVR